MADSEPLFDPSLKKKKTKKAVDFSGLDGDDSGATVTQETSAAPDAGAAAGSTAAAAAEPAGDNVDDMFGGLKKKKKSKKTIPMDLDGDAEATTSSSAAAASTEAEASGDASAAAPPSAGDDAAAAEGDGDLDFGEMKKKKKKSKKAAFDMEAFEKELGEEGAAGAGGEDETAQGDLGDDVFANEEDGDAGAGAGGEVETWHGTDRDYTYQELLGRFFGVLRANNPALSGDRKKYTIVPPQVARDGSKKTSFSNVIDICKRMHRHPDHVLQYLFAELGTTGNMDGAQRLIIKGRFQPKQIENVLRRYIVEYVTCKTCKSPNTSLLKDNRIYFIKCAACGSQRSVSAIKTGFQAQTGKRSKMRAAAAT